MHLKDLRPLCITKILFSISKAYIAVWLYVLEYYFFFGITIVGWSEPRTENLISSSALFIVHVDRSKEDEDGILLIKSILTS